MCLDVEYRNRAHDTTVRQETRVTLQALTAVVDCIFNVCFLRCLFIWPFLIYLFHEEEV